MKLSDRLYRVSFNLGGFKGDIESLTELNDAYRRVIFTGDYLQLVLMSLGPGEEIGLEVHTGTDQFFRIESGEGLFILGKESFRVGEGFGLLVPAGVEHNIINTSGVWDLKLYTIYSPPHHKAGLVHQIKEDELGD